MLRGHEISGEEAFRLGLVAEVVDDGTVDERAYELAAELTGRSPGAIANNRRLLDQTFDVDLATAVADEAEGIAELFRQPSFRAALQEFRARRAR